MSEINFPKFEIEPLATLGRVTRAVVDFVVNRHEIVDTANSGAGAMLDDSLYGLDNE
jgi:hypothetical protein